MWQKIDGTLRVLARGLDGAALRQQILSNNVANVDTPEFKSQDVNFYSQLKGFMNQTVPSPSIELVRSNVNHLPGVAVQSTPPSPFQITQSQGQVRADGNNVNIDVEMAKVAENNIYYSTLTSAVAKKYAMIQRAIKGGEQ